MASWVLRVAGAGLAAAAFACVALAHGVEARASGAALDGPELRGLVLGPEEVLELAVRHHPGLQAGASQVDAAEARALQAGLATNPELVVDVENVGVAFDEIDATELTVWVVQLLELGGKRGRRRAAAEGASEVVRQELAGLRLEIEAEAAVRFVDVCIAQRQHALAEEETERIRSALLGLREGSTAPDRARAEVRLGRAELEQARSRGGLEAARLRLAASWGGGDAEFLRVDADLDATPEPVSLSEALAGVDEAPTLSLVRSEVAMRRDELRLAESLALPDVSLSAGYRRFTGVDANGAVFSVGVPIPLFDRNQGGRQAAHHDLLRAERSARAARLELRDAVVEAHTRLVAAHGRVGAERDALLGGAERAWLETREAHRRGSVSFGTLLDVRRVLFEVRSQDLEGLREYHLARIDLAGLLGRLDAWAREVAPRALSSPAAGHP